MCIVSRSNRNNILKQSGTCGSEIHRILCWDDRPTYFSQEYTSICSSSKSIIDQHHCGHNFIQHVSTETTSLKSIKTTRHENTKMGSFLTWTKHVVGSLDNTRRALRILSSYQGAYVTTWCCQTPPLSLTFNLFTHHYSQFIGFTTASGRKMKHPEPE